MTGLATALARPEILGLPEPDIAGAGEAYGSDAIQLHLNESPYAPLTGGSRATGINRYPEPQPDRLLAAMAALYGVETGNLLITRGADDAIDLLVRTFCRPSADAVSILQPAFAAYAHFARLQGARVIEARLNSRFDFELDRFLGEVASEPSLKLAFLCSPNNPTGNVIRAKEVLGLCDALPRTLVILDEAYIEFSDTRSLAAETQRRDNLVVLRTLSKAYGLAGARIGAAIANGAIVELMRKALPPYPLPSLSTDAALTTLAPSRRLVHRQRIEEIRTERARMAAALEGSAIVTRVLAGGGNFLFLEVADPKALETRLASLGIRVRFRPGAAPGGLRLTIGTPEENDLALAAFDIFVGYRPRRRSTVTRDTSETRIAVSVDLDAPGPRRIDTGIGFFDHMLDQVAAHAGFSLTVACEGDLDIDPHHSIEDVVIAVGTALSRALGERRGIGRFGFVLPMDEARAEVLVDLAGRSFARFEGRFGASLIGSYPTEMTAHVFRSLAESLGAALHVRVSGDNDHHKTEACFKALGRALRQAIERDGSAAVPSSKGSL